MKVPKNKRFYVCYKGDNILCTGTISEIAEKLGKSLNYTTWLTTPAARKRERVAIEKRGKSDRLVLIEG